MIFTQLIQTNLRTKELGKHIEYYNRLESTNNEAWKLIEEGNRHGTVIARVITNSHTFLQALGGMTVGIISTYTQLVLLFI